jgi:hypothetical protein
MAIVASAHRLRPNSGRRQAAEGRSAVILRVGASSTVRPRHRGGSRRNHHPYTPPWLGWGTGGGGSRPENSRCGQMKASASRVNPLPSPRPCMVGGLDHADLVPRPHRLLYRNGARDFIIPVEANRFERGARSSGPPLPGEDIPWRVWPSRLPSVGGSCSGDPPASCCA